jgi:hypothetical protein
MVSGVSSGVHTAKIEIKPFAGWYLLGINFQEFD